MENWINNNGGTFILLLVSALSLFTGIVLLIGVYCDYKTLTDEQKETFWKLMKGQSHNKTEEGE